MLALAGTVSVDAEMTTACACLHTQSMPHTRIVQASTGSSAHLLHTASQLLTSSSTMMQFACTIALLHVLLLVCNCTARISSCCYIAVRGLYSPRHFPAGTAAHRCHAPEASHKAAPLQLLKPEPPEVAKVNVEGVGVLGQERLPHCSALSLWQGLGCPSESEACILQALQQQQ
jgi:hypothetical protein